MIKISGIVIKGGGQAKELGFPTANLKFSGNLDSGVYAGKVVYKNKTYIAAIFLGRSKKFLEAHLLEFSGDLYGEEIRIEVGEKIRGVINFLNNEELKKQIEKDIRNVYRYN